MSRIREYIVNNPGQWELDRENPADKQNERSSAGQGATVDEIESVCKCLLDELQQPYPSKQDIGGLVKEVQKHLSLSPGRPDLGTDIRQILGGLSAVTGGIGALRTHAGDAHGRGKNIVAADSRVARLAIHAASSVALFFIETWQDQKR